MDILAVACPTEDNIIRVKSVGHKQDDIDLSDLTPQQEESTHSASLIRGTAFDFARKGRKIGGFTAYTTSDVPKGSGLSSSAAFEVLIGSILNHFYNEGKISPEQIAITAQFAENVYFGKPSGRWIRWHVQWEILSELTSMTRKSLLSGRSASLRKSLDTGWLL